MEFQDVVSRRRMVRSYTDEPVEPAVVDRALRNATRAPNAGFTQGWGFLLLDAPEDVRRYWVATSDSIDDPDQWLRGMMRAPVIVVPCSSRTAYLDRYAEPDKGWEDRSEEHWPAPYWDIDTGMAALLILLGAVDLGLGALFFGFAPERIDPFRAAFDVPAQFNPIGAVSVGYPVEQAARVGSAFTRRRRPVGDVVHHGRFGRPWKS